MLKMNMNLFTKYKQTHRLWKQLLITKVERWCVGGRGGGGDGGGGGKLRVWD